VTEAREPTPTAEPVRFDLSDLRFSPTAALFEGAARAGIGISVFVVHTPAGGGVDLHVHPYSETFILLDGRGRWTAGDRVEELGPDQILVVPPNTPHGFGTSQTRRCSSSRCTSRVRSSRPSSAPSPPEPLPQRTSTNRSDE
jgi:mannose-6-phosphate isomerase-like protein (cupin superfamily)